MKPSFVRTSCPTFLLAVVVALLSGTPGTTKAENPFKELGAKTKQGFSKVKQAVHPRRLGTALRNVKNATVAAFPRSRPEDGPGVSSATVPPYGDRYYYDVPGPRPPALYSFTLPSPPSKKSPEPLPPPRYGALSRDTSVPVLPYPQSSPYPPVSPPPASTAAVPRAPRSLTHPQAAASSQSLDPAASPLASTPPSAATRPSPDAFPPFRSDTPDKVNLTAPPPPAPQTPRPPTPPREDLPFGGLVPGKPGFVTSPWSGGALVDVNGIPTGTKVKCPYTGKIFRVP